MKDPCSLRKYSGWGGDDNKLSIHVLKKVFYSDDLKVLNALGKYLKECMEKRTITILRNELVQKVAQIGHDEGGNLIMNLDRKSESKH